MNNEQKDREAFDNIWQHKGYGSITYEFEIFKAGLAHARKENEKEITHLTQQLNGCREAIVIWKELNESNKKQNQELKMQLTEVLNER